MKTQHLKQFLNISDATIEKESEFNPLRVVLTEEFNRNENNQTKDYRGRALDRCFAANVPFTSENNSLYDLVGRVLKVVNPKNGNVMKSKGGGGNGDSLTITFVDEETKDEISLTLSHDAISVKPYEFNYYNPNNPISKDER